MPPPALVQQLFASLRESPTGLAVICRLSDLKVVFLNERARARLNPGNSVDVFPMTLPDLTGALSRERLEAEILPQTQVRGKWSGECDLRDGWGSEFTAAVTFTVHHLAEGHGYLCLQGEEQFEATVAGKTHFTDRHLLHALLHSATDAIYFKDNASRFIRISQFQARKFGLKDPREAIGKTDFDFFDAKHAGEAYHAEQTIMRTGQPIIDQEEMETWEDGRETWCSTTKLPLRDEKGKLIGTFGVSRDITARKHAEQSEGEMVVQLQLAQKLESIGRLAAGVAHEINTPTQYINDNTHFLVEAFAKIEKMIERYRVLKTVAVDHLTCAAVIQDVAATELEVELDYLLGEIPRCLRQSQDGLARVTRIVTSLKEFAHPNSPELTPADLNRTIETSIVVCRHEWKYVAEVVTDFSPDLPPVPCVVDELNQIMLNLIVNAAHAISDALKLSGAKQGRITVRTRHEPPWAVVEVEDTGTGIPDNIRQHIFEPFFTTKAVGKGTGQGLAIVHTVVVKHHHGSIELKSEPGRGARFTLRFPLSLPPVPKT
jgi:PAS domain S-box-containing protein